MIGGVDSAHYYSFQKYVSKTDWGITIYNLLLNRKVSLWLYPINYKFSVTITLKSYKYKLLFNMLLSFLVFYSVNIFLFFYYLEGQIYLFRMLSFRASCDSYSSSFFSLLCLVSGCVFAWSFYYMDNDATFSRFSILLISFILSIVVLIFLSNLFITLVGWDALGVTSFLLVIYYKNRKRLGSGMITGLTNRLGDSLLFCLLGLFLAHDYLLGPLLLLLIIRITKRAQFPFSAWLPAAMAAPTPVRALVHSSTLVTAGVYVLIRYCHTDPVFILYAGIFTIVLAGFSACAERDLKKVVALRTISQLGVIITSIGVSEKAFCFFHLISHAIFKALIFICIGSCIHTVFGTQDYRRFNFLRSAKTITVFCLGANLSLIGLIYTSGFYRKDIILEILFNNECRSLAIFLFLLGVGLTTCYTFKLLISVFPLGSFTNTSALRIGGYRWALKLPLFFLAFIRTSFGSSVHNFRRLITITLTYTDKALTFVLILLFSLLRVGITRLHSPLIRRMSNLVPLRQSMAVTPAYLDHQKPLDKGWIEAVSLSLSPLVSSVLLHYNPAVAIGMGSIILYYTLFYDKYR